MVLIQLFKKDDNKNFQLVLKFTVGEASFSQLMQLRNHLGIAAENLSREKNLLLVPIQTISKDMDEQFKLAQKVNKVVDRAKRKICVTLPRYIVEQPENSNVQVQFF